MDSREPTSGSLNGPFFHLVRTLECVYRRLDREPHASPTAAYLLRRSAAIRRRLNSLITPSPASLEWRLRALRESLEQTPDHTLWQLATVDSVLRDLSLMGAESTD